LDADEMIAFQDFECLHRLMHEHDDGCTAFSIQTRNYSHNANMIGWQANDGRYAQLEAGIGWIASIKVRFFPRRDDIRFHFPVHERVEPALRKAGVKILTCSVPVHHYGHLDENLNRRKALNYYELGYAKLEQMSGDLQALRELAVQAGQLERWTEALQLWRLLLLIRPDFVEAHVNIAGALWQLGDYDQALAAARKAVEGDPQLREAHFNVAISLMLLKRADEAAALLKTILQAHRDYLPAWFMLAAACRILGKFNDARKLFNLLHERMTESVLGLARKDLAFRLIRAGQAEAGRLLLHDDS
jgi:tetratricopeptide (TPR) repeat protein